jgi:hypothetical protein
LVVTKLTDASKKAVGLVVAGDENGLTFVLSIDRILKYFDAELVGGHNT